MKDDAARIAYQEALADSTQPGALLWREQRGWIAANTTWVAGISWLFLVAVKTMRVAHGDVRLAVDLVPSSEVFRIGLFVLTIMSPTLLGLIFAVCLTFYPLQATTPRLVAHTAVLMIAPLTAVFIAPVSAFVPLFLSAVVVSILQFRTAKKVREEIERLTRASNEFDQELDAVGHDLAHLKRKSSLPNKAERQQMLRLDERLVDARAQSAKLLEAAADFLRAVSARSADAARLRIRITIFAIMICASLPLLTATPWVGPERVEMSNRQQSGYLFVDGEWSLLLDMSGSHPLRIKTADIESRERCSKGGNSEGRGLEAYVMASVAELISGYSPPVYPKC